MPLVAAKSAVLIVAKINAANEIENINLHENMNAATLATTSTTVREAASVS